MDTRTLGRTGLTVSEIGLCLPEGPTRAEVLRRALDLGGRVFWSESPVEAPVVLPSAAKEGYGVVQYNLLEQTKANTEIASLRAGGQGVVAMNVLAGGALAGVPGPYAERVRQLEFLKKTDRTLVQAAVQFVIANENVSCVIVRCSTVAHLEEVFAAPEAAPLTAGDLEQIFETWSNRFD